MIDKTKGNYNEIEFNEDENCDLNPSKACDSCGECLGIDNSDYRVVRIDGLASEGIEMDEYMLDDQTLNNDGNNEENDPFEVEYIEDIPELREEYNKKIDKLLGRE